jgi:hypothetical protein
MVLLVRAQQKQYLMIEISGWEKDYNVKCMGAPNDGVWCEQVKCERENSLKRKI